MNRGAISWSSKKQNLVILFTAKSEYVAAMYAAKEALWLRQIIGEIFQPLEKPITLYSDSQSAITLTKMGHIILEPNILTFGIILCISKFKTSQSI
jgi:hypothetical protein